MLSGRVQHGHLLGVKPSLLCWSLWARSATKQRYTRTCTWRAACCIWWALKQFIGAISIGGSKSSDPCVFRSNNGTWGILLGSWTHWWITLLGMSTLPLGVTVCVTPLTTLFAKAPESQLIIPRPPDGRTGDSQMIDLSESRRWTLVWAAERHEWHSTTCSSDKQVHVWGRGKWLLEGFQSVMPPSLPLSHFHNCERRSKITPRQWIIRKFMKRDECDGALHEIPMREAPQRSKCYILISTVTLCYSLHSLEGHVAESLNTQHNAVTLTVPALGCRRG